MRYIELDRILKRHGWHVVRTKGSHNQYQCDASAKTLTVPNHPGDIPLFIVKNILKAAGIHL
ncbi:type II toxin-antitoxin system HicA family toxin [Selenomonas artemidis]|uniref:Toxin-antitoxin system, toxin component, HicA family n=1 Tax=Selenomonas artemidis F0399 TaxID=749551 RepID=E7N401_9FIRM|nr:type II toxin-antitoxin system HicA family toxin [Selenomonas artemidis]EFW29042.1 toxin-antitoxin system, toxin component, HicA family [Selenomonas artemidis F0399]